MAESYSNPNPRRLRPVADVLHPLETPSDASPPCEGPQGGPSSIAIGDALKRLARLKLPRTIYERAKHEIETEGIPAIEKWVPSDPLRALQALRQAPPADTKPNRQGEALPSSAGARAERKARSVSGGEAVGGTVVQLPVWPETMSACPACMLRSALFGVVRRGRRKALERQPLPAWEGVTVRYTGMQLDQADLDVWLMALQLARAVPLGEPMYFSAHGLLQAIGRATGRQNHEWLKGAFARLTACAVEITMANKTYMGPLIHDLYRDEATGSYALVLNPKLTVLFDSLTWQEWLVRLALKTELAKWLLGYVQSHQATSAKPHRISLERLRALCGSKTEMLKKFRQQLKGAMGELKTTAVVREWRFTEGDALEFVRPEKQPESVKK